MSTGNSEASPELLDQIHGSAALPAADGLMIYHNAYRTRLLSVLRKDTETTPLQTPLECLVWRYELTCHYRTLEQPEAEALQLLMSGKSFSELCTALFDEHGEQAPLRAATWLKQWVSEGLLTEIA